MACLFDSLWFEQRVRSHGKFSKLVIASSCEQLDKFVLSGALRHKNGLPNPSRITTFERNPEVPG